jgi:hypothetical protein
MQIAPFFYLGQTDGEEESLAKSLIERLGLCEEFPAIHGSEGDGKGDVESE